MGFGSIADMFKPPYGEVVNGMIGAVLFMPLMASVDFGYNPM